MGDSACMSFIPQILYCAQPQRGEVANRILSVGSSQRAELLSQLLDPLPSAGAQLFRHLSSRGFLTITGTSIADLQITMLLEMKGVGG